MGDTDSPSATGDMSGYTAWFLARAGTAIDAVVDRAVRDKPVITDAGVQFGIDANGNLYQLGQQAGQVVAQVNTGSAASISPVLLIGLVLLVVVIGGR